MQPYAAYCYRYSVVHVFEQSAAGTPILHGITAQQQACYTDIPALTSGTTADLEAASAGLAAASGRA